MINVQKFKVKGPLYLPFYNQWGKNVYYWNEAFSFNPFTIQASSTSGSPVIVGSDFFIGFLNESGGKYTYDGVEYLTVKYPEEQKVFVRENCDVTEAWKEYNEIILGDVASVTVNKAYKKVEYCSWVEQKLYSSMHKGSTPFDMLNEKFILKYLDRIDNMKLPRGKFTIDAGWYCTAKSGGIGDWESDPAKFPDFLKVVEDIKSRGHIPGLWFAPTLVSNLSDYYMGNNKRAYGHWSFGEEEEHRENHMIAALGKDFEEQYSKVFRKYIDIGFKKFKLDIFYMEKHLMKEMLKTIYGIIKSIDSSVEVECHIPDIFVSRFCDVVRTNDVLIKPGEDWEALTKAHWDVCTKSSPDKVINLDHVGGNNPLITEEEFLKHWELFKNVNGYPVISLLPDRFSKNAVQSVKEGLRKWNRREIK